MPNVFIRKFLKDYRNREIWNPLEGGSIYFLPIFSIYLARSMASVMYDISQVFWQADILRVRRDITNFGFHLGCKNQTSLSDWNMIGLIR